MKKNFFSKKFWIPAFAVMTIWLSLFLACPAKADGGITVRLQIKANDASLYDADIAVSACADSQSASTTSINALCAVEQSGVENNYSWSGDLAFLNSIGAYANDYLNGIYWGWFENLNYSNLALNQYTLRPGDKILLAYNTNPLRISADNYAPFVGATSTITVEQFGLDLSWSPVWSPADSSTLVIGGAGIENANGIYEYVPQTAGEKIIYAEKDGYINSDSLTIAAEALETKTVRLQIKTHDASLYDADLVISECADSPTASTTSVNAMCAVNQAVFSQGWAATSTWYASDIMLNSINQYDGFDGNYWQWFGGLEYGAVALNKHILGEGEKLLLVYGINPLRLSADNAAPYVGSAVNVKLEQFGLDLSWNPVWSLAASSTLVINGAEVENAIGDYAYTATTTGAHPIYGKKAGFIDSERIILTAQAALDNSPAGGSVIITQASGGAGATQISAPSVDLAKAVNFLEANQKPDGSFGSALISDWAAMAIASVNPNGAAAQKIKNYLLADPNPLAGLNPVSDYARRAMALMSLNISPYDGTKTDYIKKIIDLFDGAQFGDASLYNDDIFALLALNKAGYGAEKEMIRQAGAFVIGKQAANGSWSGVDLTAAAIQVLKPLSSLSGADAALVKARSFLLAAQQADGGFGNSFATPWAMQAIAAFGETSGSWQKNNNTPESYLAAGQAEDGGLEKDNEHLDNRLWATAYALPAVQKKTWLDLMQSFVKPIVPILPAETAGRLNENKELIATSTLELLQVASSTPRALETATGTVEALIMGPAADRLAEGLKEKTIVNGNPVKVSAPKIMAVKTNRPELSVKGAEEEVKLALAPVVSELINQPAAEQTAREKIKSAVREAAHFIGNGIFSGISFLLKLLAALL